VGKREQRQQLRFGKRRFFRRTLDLDNAAASGEDEIGVGIGAGILGIARRADSL
jgi:hypothetical protein